MILTVLEARVPQLRAASLQSAYAALASRPLPPGLVSSRLERGVTDAELWRLETVWRDRQTLDNMRAQGTPAGVVLFRDAGSEPSLSIFEIVETIGPGTR